MDLMTAQKRIYEWAKNSPNLSDKIACDVAFEALREAGATAAELRELRAELSQDD